MNSSIHPGYSIEDDNLSNFFWRDIESGVFNKKKKSGSSDQKKIKCSKILTKRIILSHLELLSNLHCYLDPNKYRRKIKVETDSFGICADSGASSCATPDQIYFIPGTYRHFNVVKINWIAEELKVAGCGSVSWILQYDKKDNI